MTNPPTSPPPASYPAALSGSVGADGLARACSGAARAGGTSVGVGAVLLSGFTLFLALGVGDRIRGGVAAGSAGWFGVVAWTVAAAAAAGALLAIGIRVLARSATVRRSAPGDPGQFGRLRMELALLRWIAVTGFGLAAAAVLLPTSGELWDGGPQVSLDRATGPVTLFAEMYLLAFSLATAWVAVAARWAGVDAAVASGDWHGRAFQVIVAPPAPDRTAAPAISSVPAAPASNRPTTSPQQQHTTPLPVPASREADPVRPWRVVCAVALLAGLALHLPHLRSIAVVTVGMAKPAEWRDMWDKTGEATNWKRVGPRSYTGDGTRQVPAARPASTAAVATALAATVLQSAVALWLVAAVVVGPVLRRTAIALSVVAVGGAVASFVAAAILRAVLLADRPPDDFLGGFPVGDSPGAVWPGVLTEMLYINTSLFAVQLLVPVVLLVLLTRQPVRAMCAGERATTR